MIALCQCERLYCVHIYTHMHIHKQRTCKHMQGHTLAHARPHTHTAMSFNIFQKPSRLSYMICVQYQLETEYTKVHTHNYTHAHIHIPVLHPLPPRKYVSSDVDKQVSSKRTFCFSGNHLKAPEWQLSTDNEAFEHNRPERKQNAWFKQVFH